MSASLLSFYIFSSVILLSSLMVISTKNPVHSVLFLILTFFPGVRKYIPAIELIKVNFSKSPLKLEYFEISEAKTLHPLKEYNPSIKAVIFIAAYLGNIRLMENSSGLLYRTYKTIGQLDNALAMHELYIEMRDSISLLNNHHALAKQELKHKYEKIAAIEDAKHAAELKQQRLYFVCHR